MVGRGLGVKGDQGHWWLLVAAGRRQGSRKGEGRAARNGTGISPQGTCVAQEGARSLPAGVSLHLFLGLACHPEWSRLTAHLKQGSSAHPKRRSSPRPPPRERAGQAGRRRGGLWVGIYGWRGCICASLGAWSGRRSRAGRPQTAPACPPPPPPRPWTGVGGAQSPFEGGGAQAAWASFGDQQAQLSAKWDSGPVTRSPPLTSRGWGHPGEDGRSL